ncbi:alpha/beta hydrolase [Rhodococcus sp. IEGM 1366]|uniref:alpha/beta fold hydrolase n=1 Tax=Rhodococcus sp. IEGM 1366 TaxID=3082223 RepID=UPI002953BDC2|nr:alpha/beta hydrolase [Rhodococcus sp. IEGM 1366]MDV8071349.1 alpha/beta hydrolase [Rhodococcus sp. IEGM 1366]
METRYLTQTALADLANVPATSRWVRTTSLALHVLDYGGAGKPVLILPGISSPAITMDFVARRLTDLVRPITVDIRGRGLSDSASSYSLDDYAEDVEAIVNDLDLEGVTLLGHSMGARIAAVTAARKNVTVSSLILVDPPMSGPGRAPYPTTLPVFLDQLGQAQRGTTVAEVAHSWPRWPEAEQRLRAHWLSSCDGYAIGATHRGFETEDFFDTWPQLTGEVALVYGRASPVVTAEGVAYAEFTNPGAEFVSVPDAGHMVFWDNPDGALTVVRHLLQ